ncbi:peptide/nickel transport system ATP-binding protein/oligopeptide transport system ATP-binding protein [Antricoccus suffuscus]|uniref:Peptide/nickel transport system ATP-binding protein/oligopeptide transport system ATP-binding protein n=1 Tax=Antricoccus suffuscus TaxID=1629062 RepID=A0A2T1A695_9ACTN|nr:ATP-binding cassette domain-containing protein [Antricoccus suffuscus]PRZ44133.1 peptide/nickel transport system ATP-binding protein/oligopeptide transport system ATP-binding protein [Antricoccus suffuscus]
MSTETGTTGTAKDVAGASTAGGDVVLEASGLCKRFVTGRNWLGRPSVWLDAVKDVSLSLRSGETLALVGESGSGKSTTARLVTQLETPDAGTVTVLGDDWTALSAKELRSKRRGLQMVFQDPFASLNPMKMIVFNIGEPLIVHEGLGGKALDARVLELLELVGLPATALHRYPHEFSGGQRQRIAIARALAADPQVIVADEAVSALDVSTQAQILNLLKDIQAERGLAFLFITHDLGVVRQVADRIAVMNLGEIVEQGDADQVFDAPAQEYTQSLLSAVPEVSAKARRERAAVVSGSLAE